MAVKLVVSAFIFLLFDCSALAAPVTTVPIRSMYVLGDSLSDQGNMLAATTVLGAPLGQPGIPDQLHYFQGRFSNGENYVDVLASDLGFSVTPSLAGGTNFAFGGTRTNYNIIEQPLGPYPPGAYPWTLNLQTRAFLAPAATRDVDPTALYVVFSGSNDIGDILSLRLNPATTIASL